MEKQKRRRNYSKLIVRGILIFSVFYLASTFYDQYKEMKYLAEHEAALSQTLQELQEEVDSLKDQIENSNTDEHIEKIAREHLKMVKKDELIFIDLGKDAD